MALVNEGGWDRAVRILSGIVLAYAAWAVWPSTVAWSTGSIAALLLLVVAVMMFVTGLAGWCPAYTAFHFSTTKRTGA